MVIVTIVLDRVFITVILGCGGRFVNGIKKAQHLLSLFDSSIVRPVSSFLQLRSTFLLPFQKVGGS